LTVLIHHTLGKDSVLCTGCAACAAICPEDAITMIADGEGFLHPNIHLASCTDCRLCLKVCPVNRSMIKETSRDTQDKTGNFPKVLAAWHLDSEIRGQSSSGGVFSALAENALNKGGVVVGASFDEELVVRHCIIEKHADLHKLRGSKYVQSQISPNLYRAMLSLLKDGRTVLFSGTPCQVAAVKNISKKFHDTLFCCDILCHGVPAPRLFARYILAHSASGDTLTNISFRDKKTGWKKFSITQHFSDGRSKSSAISDDPYMLAFLRNYTLRPSCYDCKFTNLTRFGDLTLADFWGVEKNYPEYDKEDKGTSLVLVNSDKGQTWLENCRGQLFLGPADIHTAIVRNPMLVQPARKPIERITFYHDLETLGFDALVLKYQLHKQKHPFHIRIIRSIKRRVKIATTKLTRQGQK